MEINGLMYRIIVTDAATFNRRCLLQTVAMDQHQTELLGTSDLVVHPLCLYSPPDGSPF